MNSSSSDKQTRNPDTRRRPSIAMNAHHHEPNGIKGFVLAVTVLAATAALGRAQPVLQLPVVTSNLITLTCSAVPGNLYQFQRATNLASGSNGWSNIGSFIVPTNNAITIRDLLSGYWLNAFYQVQMIPSNLVVNIPTIISASYGGDTIAPQAFTNGDFKSVVFTGSGTFTISSGSSGPVESLVVAGGGAGGEYVLDGGGGAGGVILTPLFSSPSYSAGTYTVTVGAGGQSYNAYGVGDSGGNSSFGNSTVGQIVAMGGGGGAGYSASSGGDANSGGSGGGGSAPGINGASSLANGAGSIPGTQYGNLVAEGNSGGNAVNNVATYPYDLAGGGGGGAGQAGSDATSVSIPTYGEGGKGGNGGNGLSFAMTGSAAYDTWYAGGGAGSGSGILENYSISPYGVPGQGQNSFGGGGDGDGQPGHSGIVILRYKFQ